MPKAVESHSTRAPLPFVNPPSRPAATVSTNIVSGEPPLFPGQAAGKAAVPGGDVLLVARQKKELAAAARHVVWTIYAIRRRRDGRTYVGVTKRDVAVRVAMHEFLARRHPECGGPGSLAEAIREASKTNNRFDTVFTVEELAKTSSKRRARELEKQWIDQLGTFRPGGFNIMPGGASLGGPANAVPITVHHPIRGRLRFASMMEAVADINRERSHDGQGPLELSIVYSRRSMEWSIEEALELAHHPDGRRRRAPFRWHGHIYESLAELSAAEGLPLATIRSRLQRAREAGCGPDHDAGSDRRAAGSHRVGGVGCGRLPPLVLPHPQDPQATVNAREFAKLSGVPVASVLHRHRCLITAGRDPAGMAGMAREDVLAALTAVQDRRVVITLVLPDGRTLTDGVREVVAQVLTDPVIKFARDEWIGASAIRARLRRLPGWPGNLTPDAIRWAFGFQPDARPARLPAAA